MIDPELLRAEARKCRYFAEAISDLQARDELMKLAADYDDRAALIDTERAGEVAETVDRPSYTAASGPTSAK